MACPLFKNYSKPDRSIDAIIRLCIAKPVRFVLLILAVANGFLAFEIKPLSGTENRVLVFSKTEGYRHTDAINAGQKAILKMATENHFIIDTTEDSKKFTEENLKGYRAVVLLNISGAVFTLEQRVSLQRFVQAGGGVLAIHASADAERDWPWYGRLIGAYFDSHPPVQKGFFKTVNKNHPATAFMPDTISRTDEFYNFQGVSPDINVLISLDENSYSGGNMGEFHPAAWYQEFDGGRSFYTSWGHSKESWGEAIYLRQVSAALKWVCGGEELRVLDYSKSIPEDNRFIRYELMTKMDEPMQMAITKNGNVFIAQRRGSIFLYDAKTNTSLNIGTIPVLSAYEDGLLGIAADPAFDDNKFLYVFYASPGLKDSISDYRISRFTLNSKGKLDFRSEKVLIKIPHQNADGIHTGGGMLFDPRENGDLFVSVGDNTSPRATLYTPIDERQGRELFNAQRSASNTNDLRGKILRIHPEASGTYTIPDGNLFPKEMAKTRPEIYSMGHRQPWRLSMDTKTGWLYEGEVGPDASLDSVDRGPMAYDEFNQIRKPGNFGWPYFNGNNRAYNEYDFTTGKPGPLFNLDKPINRSRLNTGLNELPPAQAALVWYSYSTPKEFPLMGSGARSAIGGPIYRKADYKNAKASFPGYYEGKWFITEWIRDWIMVVSMDEKGNYKSMERFLPGVPVAGPMDMQFGPDGSLYILEYGKGWFRQNNDSKLTRIEYTPDNRHPVPVITANRLNGSVPFTVNFSSVGTRDYDNDALTYEWTIKSPAGNSKIIKSENTKVLFDKVGRYKITLTARDTRGGAAYKTVQIDAGNSAPIVKIKITKGNSTFFFPDEEITYMVSVNDAEDGSLANGKIPSSKVAVNMNYSSEGFSYPSLGGPIAEQKGIGIKGGMIINSNDCYHCHSINVKSAGPSFMEISERNKRDRFAEERLAKKIITGGSGVWGTVSMSAHPELRLEDAKKMASFILNLSHPPPPSMPVAGKHKIALPKRLSSRGVYVLHASYKDKGANGISSLTGEDVVVLRAPSLLPSKAEYRKGGMNVKTPNPRGEVEILRGSGSYLGYKNIDLAGISEVQVEGEGNGILEVRTDSATGKIIGDTQGSVSKNATGKNLNATGLKINVAGVKGIHDIYFVVRGRSYSIKNFIKFLQ